jgi:hypothetical protein
VGKPEMKRPLARPRPRWKNNIKIGLRQMGCGGIGWINLTHDRNLWKIPAKTVMNFRVLYNILKFLSS